MPEGRMLKKYISESKKLGYLKSDSARLFYTWLLPHLDVEGRYSADPDILKGHIFPKVKSMTISKIKKLLNELAKVDLIILYRSNGETYLQLKQFHKYQKIDRNREAKSKIPPPTEKNRIYSGINQENSGLNQIKSPISLNKVNESLSKDSLCLKKISDEDKKLTQLLINLMLENDPNSSTIRNLTEKNQIEWMDACRKLREIDKRPPELIERIIRFSQGDDFWKGNILSMPKLRKKFDQLVLKAKKAKFSGIKQWLEESK